MKKNINKTFGIIFAAALGLSVFSVPTAHAAGFTTVTISSQKEKDTFADNFIDKKGNVKLDKLTKFVEEQTGLGDCKITNVKKAKDSNTYVVTFERNKLEYDFTTDGSTGKITDIRDIVLEKDYFAEKFIDKKGNIKYTELTKFIEEQTGLGDCKITKVEKAKDSNTYVVTFERNKLEYDFSTDGNAGMITEIRDIVPSKPDHDHDDDDWFDDDRYDDDDDDDRYDDDDDDDRYDD
ncbi:MAG: hypothetical protein Q4B86_08145 [Eubacteriales bacterium]|nr:hypothetical protein [Eubacteriales bacterium]